MDIRSPSTAQCAYLDKLARMLGHPNGKSFAQDLQGTDSRGLLIWTNSRVADAISEAVRRLTKQGIFKQQRRPQKDLRGRNAEEPTTEGA